MSCERDDDVLGEFVDGARAAGRAGAPDPRLAGFESHLAGCARCQALVADFTSIRRAAAALDGPPPPPRLWETIASSIDDERRARWWGPVAVAASLALLLGGAAWLVWPTPPPAAPQAGAAPAPDRDAMPADQQYEQAIAGLQRLAEAQNPGLDPRTRAVLEQNLAVVDLAISESRAALSAEPASALAQDSLLDALDTKVALLQDTVALAGEIGGDSPDDPSGAVKELNQ